MDDLLSESEISIVVLADKVGFDEKKYRNLLPGYRIAQVARFDINEYERAIECLGDDYHMVEIYGFLYGRSEGSKELEKRIRERDCKLAERGVHPTLLGVGKLPPADQQRISEIRISGE